MASLSFIGADRPCKGCSRDSAILAQIGSGVTGELCLGEQAATKSFDSFTPARQRRSRRGRDCAASLVGRLVRYDQNLHQRAAGGHCSWRNLQFLPPLPGCNATCHLSRGPDCIAEGNITELLRHDKPRRQTGCDRCLIRRAGAATARDGSGPPIEANAHASKGDAKDDDWLLFGLLASLRYSYENTLRHPERLALTSLCGPVVPSA